MTNITDGSYLADYVTGLERENERLRERIHELEIEYDGAVDAVAEKSKRIEWLCGRHVGETDENERLRELVRDMWFWCYEGYIDRESQECQMKHIDGVLDRMRELGVVV